MPDERIEIMRRVALFDGLSDRELEAVANASKERRFDTGDTVVGEGEGGVGFFVVLDGTATVTVGGREVNKLGPGDWFGEMALLSTGGKRTATVTADSDLRCAGMTAWEFKPFLANHPDAAWQVLETMAQRSAASGP